MSAKSKTLIAALAVLVLLIGAYAGARAWQKKKASEKPASTAFQESIRLTEFDSSEISKIEIISSELVLEKNDGLWQLTFPQKKGIAIDQNAVSGKLWSISNLRADRVIEEEAVDLSQYGLDDPQGHTIITDSANKKAEVFFGNFTPGRDSYYVMVKGDPKVYTVYYYSVQNFTFKLDDIRKRDLLPDFDPVSLTRFILENPDLKIEVEEKKGDDFLISSFSSFVITSPYRNPRAADSEKFGNIQQSLGNLRIGEFIDDEPKSLAPYGLDKPGRLYIESPAQSLDLNFGYGADGALYVKLAVEDGVFTVPGLEDVINTKPFAIADKFILIFHIDTVKDYTVSGDGRTIRAEIRGTKDEPEFFLDGRRTADKEFRNYYQAVIGLLADAEYPGPQGKISDGPAITITFNMKEPEGASASVSLTPYNRDFYSVTQNGETEFLLSRSQVQNIFESADKMVYEE